MAGRAALRQHQQKERLLPRTSSYLSLASSDGQASNRKPDDLSSSPGQESTAPGRKSSSAVAASGESPMRRILERNIADLAVRILSVMNADW